MEHRPNSLDEKTLTSERAFEWLQLLEKASSREQEAFYKWLGRSPQNSGEVLMATSTELVMRELFRDKRVDVDQLLATSANVLTIDRMRLQDEPPRRKRVRMLAIIGVAAAAAVAALIVTPVLVQSWIYPHEYTTSVGEQRAVELPDGSAISINTQSSVRVVYSATTRDVYLSNGQAMFDVAKDSRRPFRVHVVVADADGKAGKDMVVQAVGTKFDVRRRSDRVNVAVIEGIVQVQPEAGEQTHDMASVASEPAKVAAGQGVSIESSGRITPPAPVNPSDVSAWQERRLVFADNTLEEIAEEFRRYNRTPQIQIEGAELRGRRFSGVFDADHPDALLLYLQSDRSIEMERNGEVVIIRPRSATTPR